MAMRGEKWFVSKTCLWEDAAALDREARATHISSPPRLRHLKNGAPPMRMRPDASASLRMPRTLDVAAIQHNHTPSLRDDDQCVSHVGWYPGTTRLSSW